MPSGFQSLIPLSGAGLCEAVIIAPHAYSAAPRASVGVETSPASTTSDPVDKTPAMSAWASIGPVSRGSRPTIVRPCSSPNAIPTCKARSGVTSTLPRPRMPDDPKRVTGRDTTRAIESLRERERTTLKEALYIDARIRERAIRRDRRQEGSDGHGARNGRGRDREGEEERSPAGAG